MTRSRNMFIILIMEHADEIRRLCGEARAFRLRISMAAGRRTLALEQLRESLAERERLLMWSRELQVRAVDTADRYQEARATDQHQERHI
jgi:hypothetical protein